MSQSGDPLPDLTLMRITLMGNSDCGKTSLINALVNNNIPGNYQPTEEESLYYTLMRSQSDDSTACFSVLCEIEDTCGSDRLGEVMENFFDPWWPKRQEIRKNEKPQGAEHVDEEGMKRSAFCPLGTYEPPLNGEFRPLTKNRMAYFFVFDATDKKSYLEALRIHSKFLDYYRKRGLQFNPVVFLVANKVDKDPLGETYAEVMREAEIFSEFHKVPLFSVSALQYKGVKKLFRTALQTVRIHQELWILNFKQKDEIGPDMKKCVVQ